MTVVVPTTDDTKVRTDYRPESLIQTQASKSTFLGFIPRLWSSARLPHQNFVSATRTRFIPCRIQDFVINHAVASYVALKGGGHLILNV
jgi:hypothetical protein